MSIVSDIGVRGRRCCGITVLTCLVLALVAWSAEEPETGLRLPALTGDWAVRTNFENRGVTPAITLTTEGWGNVAGGLKRGAWWNSLLDIDIALDTARLGWWQGGTFFAEVHWAQNLRSDIDFGDYTGAFNPVSSIFASDHLRVFDLYYQHSWREGALTFKAGQIAVDDDFM
ncbi:MAG TPA: carbohydrate porin, partial [Tepidisphaeraceae bacterium]|nr:carbohydrate porin [Tepidisphaeraceae bacterium]